MLEDETRTIATATDAAGNTGSASFDITVVATGDVTPPVVTVPADITVDATDASGAVVTFSIDHCEGSLSALSDTTSISCTAQTILTFGDSIGITNIIASLQGSDSPDSVTFTAYAVPPTIKIVGGNEQLGDPLDILPKPLQVMITNFYNEPMEGIIINYNIVNGNGKLSAIVDTTNSIGR